MKLLNLSASALLATVATARYTGVSSSAVTPLDENYKVPGHSPLEHCANPEGDLLAIKSVDISPNPPKPGKTLTITAEGTLEKDVAKGAYVKLRVKYGLINLISTTADLCEQVEKVDLECPLEKGKLKLTKEVDLPSAIPPGTYTVQADVYSDDDEPVTCLTARVEFKRPGDDGLFKQEV